MQRLRCGPYAELCGAADVGGRYLVPRASNVRAVGSGASVGRSDTFPNAGPFKLTEGTQDVKLKPSGGRAEVDPLSQRHEGDPQRVQFVHERDEVTQRSAEPVEAPDHKHVEAAAASIVHKLIERGPAVGGAADAGVDVLLGQRPTAGLDVGVHVGLLVGAVLPVSGHTQVEGDSHFGGSFPLAR